MQLIFKILCCIIISTSKKCERKNIMKIAGIVLLVLQAISIIGSVLNGSFADMFADFSVYGIGKLLGFFIPAIIGAILLAFGIKKAKKNGKKDK